jgi:hypothetical protein
MQRAAQLGPVEGLSGGEGAKQGVLESVGVLGAGIAIELEVDGSGIVVDEPDQTRGL